MKEYRLKETGSWRKARGYDVCWALAVGSWSWSMRIRLSNCRKCGPERKKRNVHQKQCWVPSKKLRFKLKRDLQKVRALTIIFQGVVHRIYTQKILRHLVAFWKKIINYQRTKHFSINFEEMLIYALNGKALMIENSVTLFPDSFLRLENSWGNKFPF